jgi:predicted transcriptional regulator
MTKADFQAIKGSKVLQQLTKDGLYQRRLIDKVSIFMVYNENEATVQFEGLDGKIDTSFAFYGTNKKFLEWCSDFFEYRWRNSKQFDFSKLDIN